MYVIVHVIMYMYEHDCLFTCVSTQSAEEAKSRLESQLASVSSELHDVREHLQILYIYMYMYMYNIHVHVQYITCTCTCPVHQVYYEM